MPVMYFDAGDCKRSRHKDYVRLVPRNYKKSRQKNYLRADPHEVTHYKQAE